MSQPVQPPQAMDTTPIEVTPTQQQQQQLPSQQQPPLNDRKRPAETSNAELEKSVLEEQLKEIARLKEFERKIKERGVDTDELLDTYDKSRKAKEETKLAETKTMLEQFEQDVLPVIPENERESAKLVFADYLKRGDQNAFQAMRIQTAANHRNRQMHLEVEARLKQVNKQLEEERAARQELENARVLSQAFASTLQKASTDKPKSMMSTWEKSFSSIIDSWAGITPSTSTAQKQQGQTGMELDNPFAIRQPAQTVPSAQQPIGSTSTYSVGTPAATQTPIATPQSQPAPQSVTTTASGVDPTDGVAYIRNRFMKACDKEFSANGPMNVQFEAEKYSLINSHFEQTRALCSAPKDGYISDYRDVSSAGIKKPPSTWSEYRDDRNALTGYFIRSNI